jgi:hypothetical protein
MPATKPSARSKYGPEAAIPPAAAVTPQMFLAQISRAALFGLDAFEANLRIWRTVIDALNEMSRSQQQAALRARECRSKLEVGQTAPAEMAPPVAPLQAQERHALASDHTVAGAPSLHRAGSS